MSFDDFFPDLKDSFNHSDSFNSNSLAELNLTNSSLSNSQRSHNNNNNNNEGSILEYSNTFSKTSQTSSLSSSLSSSTSTSINTNNESILNLSTNSNSNLLFYDSFETEEIKEENIVKKMLTLSPKRLTKKRNEHILETSKTKHDFKLFTKKVTIIERKLK